MWGFYASFWPNVSPRMCILFEKCKCAVEWDIKNWVSFFIVDALRFRIGEITTSFGGPL